MASCNPTTLLASAKCFSCLTKKELKTAILQLLCEIYAAGGGGGGSGLTYAYSGTGSPVGVITPLADAAVYFDKSTGTQWNWYNSSWH